MSDFLDHNEQRERKPRQSDQAASSTGDQMARDARSKLFGTGSREKRDATGDTNAHLSPTGDRMARDAREKLQSQDTDSIVFPPKDAFKQSTDGSSVEPRMDPLPQTKDAKTIPVDLERLLRPESMDHFGAEKLTHAPKEGKGDQILSPEEKVERSRIAHPIDGVGFPYNSAEVNPVEVKRFLESRPQSEREAIKDERATIYLTVMSSRPGTDSYNQDLANRRGESLAKVLKEQFGAKAHIEVDALGEKHAEDEGKSEAKDDYTDRIAFIHIDPGENQAEKSTPNNLGRDVKTIANEVVTDGVLDLEEQKVDNESFLDELKKNLLGLAMPEARVANLIRLFKEGNWTEFQGELGETMMDAQHHVEFVHLAEKLVQHTAYDAAEGGLELLGKELLPVAMAGFVIKGLTELVRAHEEGKKDAITQNYAQSWAKTVAESVFSDQDRHRTAARSTGREQGRETMSAWSPEKIKTLRDAVARLGYLDEAQDKGREDGRATVDGWGSEKTKVIRDTLLHQFESAGPAEAALKHALNVEVLRRAGQLKSAPSHTTP